MTTSESKGRFFYKTNRFESIRTPNRIASNRELECSRQQCDSVTRGRESLSLLRYTHKIDLHTTFYHVE